MRIEPDILSLFCRMNDGNTEKEQRGSKVEEKCREKNRFGEMAGMNHNSKKASPSLQSEGQHPKEAGQSISDKFEFVLGMIHFSLCCIFLVFAVAGLASFSSFEIFETFALIWSSPFLSS
jgi:hypothetical protein